MPSYQNVIALKIMKKYNTFCANHNLLPKSKIEEEKIKALTIKIKDALERFKEKYSDDPRVASAYLYYKLEKMVLKKKRIWVIFKLMFINL